MKKIFFFLVLLFAISSFLASLFQSEKERITILAASPGPAPKGTVLTLTEVDEILKKVEKLFPNDKQVLEESRILREKIKKLKEEAKECEVEFDKEKEGKDEKEIPKCAEKILNQLIDFGMEFELFIEWVMNNYSDQKQPDLEI